MGKEKRVFLSRNEPFGKTVFDPVSFEHFLLTDKEYELFLGDNSVLHNDNELFENPNPGIIHAPIRNYFDITLSCNLRCRTCLNDSGSPLEDELSADIAIKVLQGMSSDGVFNVKFSGGEPTKKDGWFDIMTAANDLGLVIAINSNGIYSDDTLDRIVELAPAEVTISLDGHKRVNDSIRGQGSFYRAVESIRALHQAGINVAINSVVHQGTDLKEVEQLMELAEAYCQNICFFPMKPLGRAQQMPGQILDYSGLVQVMREINRIKANFDVSSQTSSSTRRIDIGSEVPGLFSGGADGFTRMNIMPDGSIYAGGCALYVSPELKQGLRLGNIVEEGFSILPIWHLSPKLAEIRAFSSGLKEDCENCSDYQVECPGFSLEMEYYRKENGYNPHCKE